MEEPSTKNISFTKKKRNYDIGFGAFLLSKGSIINGRLFVFTSKIQFFRSSLRLTRKIKYVLPCCLFFSSIMMALEQTKYCCFKQISNARQAFIIFLSLKSSKFLNFWRLLFFLSSFKYCGPKNKYHIVLFGLRKHFQGIRTATLIFAQFFQGKNILMFCSQNSKAKRKIFSKELQGNFFSDL